MRKKATSAFSNTDFIRSFKKKNVSSSTGDQRVSQTSVHPPTTELLRSDYGTGVTL